LATTVPVAPERLRSSRDVAATLRAERLSGRLLVLHHRSRSDVEQRLPGRPRGDDGPPRLTVMASRRVGTAVDRNRAKRLLREAARATSWPAGTDVVVVARPGCATATLSAIVSDLDEVRARIGWQ
jgi:ribonuclease P protein component